MPTSSAVKYAERRIRKGQQQMRSLPTACAKTVAMDSLTHPPKQEVGV